MLSGMIASGQLYSGWRWEKEKLAIGEYAIHVEQKKFDFLGARLGIGHARIVAKEAFSYWLLAVWIVPRFGVCQTARLRSRHNLLLEDPIKS